MDKKSYNNEIAAVKKEVAAWPSWMLGDNMTHKVIIPTDEDIKYFEQKLEKATHPATKAKIQKQLDAVKDAVVIYHLQHDFNS